MLLLQRFVIVVDVDERIVGDGYYSLAGVAIDASESANLTDVKIAETCQFEDDAVCSLVDAFVGIDKTSV